MDKESDNTANEAQGQQSTVENDHGLNVELQRSHSQPTASLSKSSDGKDAISGLQSSCASMRSLPRSAIQTKDPTIAKELSLASLRDPPILITQNSPTLHRKSDDKVDPIGKTRKYAPRFYKNRADIEDIGSPA